MLKLHFNSANGIFSLRWHDRSMVSATGRNARIPFIGSIHSLSPSVHALMTKGLLVSASKGKRPEVPVVVTKWPRLRLLIARIKEYINE